MVFSRRGLWWRWRHDAPVDGPQLHELFWPGALVSGDAPELVTIALFDNPARAKGRGASRSTKCRFMPVADGGQCHVDDAGGGSSSR